MLFVEKNKISHMCSQQEMEKMDRNAKKSLVDTMILLRDLCYIMTDSLIPCYAPSASVNSRFLSSQGVYLLAVPPCPNKRQ
jgi:hypothetical protein